MQKNFRLNLKNNVFGLMYPLFKNFHNIIVCNSFFPLFLITLYPNYINC